MDYFFVIAGLACLLIGGDWLVKGAVDLSKALGLPAFLISLTVVGFGTSLPELLVSVRAALSGAPGLALGNVVGSNVANILLIIGAAAVISPVPGLAKGARRDLYVMFSAAFALVLMLWTGTLGFTLGLAMTAALCAYLILAYFQDRPQKSTQDFSKAETHDTHSTPSKDIEPDASQPAQLKIGLFILSGLILLSGGAELLIRGSNALATQLGISPAIIGLTIVAVGTSLPELATSLTAAFKRQSDIALGNVIGSNIFNIFGILGLTALIAPIPVAARFTAIDGFVLLGVTALFCVRLVSKNGIHRLWGVIFLSGYAGYLTTML